MVWWRNRELDFVLIRSSTATTTATTATTTTVSTVLRIEVVVPCCWRDIELAGLLWDKYGISMALVWQYQDHRT